MPFRHGAIRADRAEVPSESARLLSLLGHFREISMKVPGTGLPDLEGGRRGWAAHLLNLPNARSFMEISRKHRKKRALSLAGCLRVLGGTKESHTSNVQDGKAW